VKEVSRAPVLLRVFSDAEADDMEISPEQHEDLRAQIAELAELLRGLATRIERVDARLDEALSRSDHDDEER
jgi:hypothetical protein